MTALPGEYYRARKPEKGAPNLVCVTQIDEEGVHYCSGDRRYSWETEKFLQYYEHEPNGREQRGEEIKKLLAEIEAAQPVTPKLLLEGPTLAVGKTGKVSVQQVQGVRQQIATTRNSIKKFKKTMLVKQKQLQALLSEQAYALKAKVNSLQAFVEKAEEMLWTVNVYLGKNETILRLKKGKLAPKGTKIAIRQLTLFMDEECAVAARDGGISAVSIPEFDKWVVKARHLQQVLPEEKGIVAFKVRRESKRYADAMTQAEMGAADSKTYFLIRNGERLYRIWADLEVRSVFFPRRDEFEELMTELKRDWETNAETRVKLRPGDLSYMRALKRAEGRKRHYLRCLLFLQGLLDRTHVFAPLPQARINICDQEEAQKYLHFVRDAEMLLTEGRESFNKWLARVNGELDIGHRVMGVFGTYSFREGRGSGDRSHPRGHTPDSCVPYTIEQKQGGGITFLFTRQSWAGRDVARRASYKLWHRDRFILNVDTAAVPDMQWFLQSRINRHNYVDMFPLLKAAIKFKKKEAKVEAPFRKLLVAQIVKRHDATVEEALQEIDALIRWWKFKNRIHRALLADDKKALRMIVHEFELSRAQTKALAQQSNVEKAIVALLRKRVPDVMLIAHRKGTDYAVLAPMNEDKLFVREAVWSYSRKEKALSEKSAQEWVLLDKRIYRWVELWSSPRWKNWKVGVFRGRVLTDPEIKQAVKWTLEYCEENARENVKNSWREELKEKKRRFRFLPLAATWDREKFDLHVYFSQEKPLLPKKRILTSRLDGPEICYVSVRWKRRKTGLEFTRSYSRELSISVRTPPWRYHKGSRFDHEANRNTRLVWSCEENIETLVEEEEEHDRIKEEREKLENVVRRAIDAVGERVYGVAVKKAHDEFVEDLGDEELWPDHLKELKIEHHPYLHTLREALYRVVEQNVNLTGLTLKRIVARAKKFGFTLKGKGWRDEEQKFDENLPWSFRLPDVWTEPKEEEEPKEEDDEPVDEGEGTLEFAPVTFVDDDYNEEDD